MKIVDKRESRRDVYKDLPTGSVFYLWGDLYMKTEVEGKALGLRTGFLRSVSSAALCEKVEVEIHIVG